MKKLAGRPPNIWRLDNTEIDNKRVPIANSQFKDLILTNFFLPANLKGRDNVKFYLPLLTGHHRQRSGRAVFDKNSHLFPASTSFPRIPSAGSGVSRVSQWASSWSPETEEEEE